MVSKTNKNLFRIVEQIAEKEIEKDPIDFIRRESLNVDDRMDRDKFMQNLANIRNGQIDPIQEDDDEYLRGASEVSHQLRPSVAT